MPPIARKITAATAFALISVWAARCDAQPGHRADAEAGFGRRAAAKPFNGGRHGQPPGSAAGAGCPGSTTWILPTMVWWPMPQYSLQTTLYSPARSGVMVITMS